MAGTGVNPVDAVTRAGVLAEAELTAPRANTGTGWDMAGTIDAVRAGITGFTPRHPAVGLHDHLHAHLDTYADHIVPDTDTPAPAGLPLTAAATLPLNRLTPLQTPDTVSYTHP